MVKDTKALEDYKGSEIESNYLYFSDYNYKVMLTFLLFKTCFLLIELASKVSCTDVEMLFREVKCF